MTAAGSRSFPGGIIVPCEYRLVELERRQMRIILAVCTILGLGLRVAMAGRGGLWCDEAQFLWIVRMPTLRAMIDFLCHHESHPPLFYILMRGWLSFFGDSEPAALALPILLGAALVPATYHVGNRVFSSDAGLLAALLVAAAPLLALHSGFARPYSLLPLLCLTATYLLWCGLGGGSKWFLGCPSDCQSRHAPDPQLGLDGVWSTALVVGMELLYGRLSLGTFRRWLLLQVAVLTGYAAWVPILLYQVRHTGYGPRLVTPLEAIIIFVRRDDLASGFCSTSIRACVDPSRGQAFSLPRRRRLRHIVRSCSSKGPACLLGRPFDSLDRGSNPVLKK